MEKDNKCRPRSHEIDTAARRKVPTALPDAWEHRESTGRDYGIDMTIEIFKEGCSTGNQLELQIKGTEKLIDDKEDVYDFDMPVKSLRYIENHHYPVLLVICPVNRPTPMFYYVWLQDYIQVVLEKENPEWRLNRSTVRIKVPIQNSMPGNEKHLSYIANHLRRVSDWKRLGAILHEFKQVFWSNDVGDWSKAEIAEAKRLLEKALELDAIFGDPPYAPGQLQKIITIDPAIKAAELLLRGGPFTVEEVRSVGTELTDDALRLMNDETVELDIAEMSIKFVLSHTENRLSSALSTANDNSLKYLVWKQRGEHDF
ncbi:hypothetical protein Pan241w_26310 [Gimesia alba]|uniref:DUF4365 domain-containing protein n=1 Tax=Gimesia alba TaxID=2527973 RepID=A0A517RF96_9PLAN|nr:DUF4365 domain-containing protein [Gimesia alba]QDT42546.1 hypothetical protein Pan241w_26310 [Gimesia alba]